MFSNVVVFVFVASTFSRNSNHLKAHTFPGGTETSKLFKYDQSIFQKHRGCIKTELIFHTHSIEKGLSHAEFYPGFGLKTLEKMRNVMMKMDDKISIEYINALATLKEYFEVHKGFDISKQKRILGEVITREIQDTISDIGGSKIITNKSKENNEKVSFDTLMQNRYSVREYANTTIPEKNIVEAVKIAQKTPTACNRQSARVVIIQNSRTIEKTLKLQGGLNGYRNPPCLLLVTADNEAYLYPNERHQAYIDGGLFTMSLLLALEFKSLAAVPLHTMFSIETDVAIRKLLNIPQSELLISFISVGNFRKINKVAKSFRYSVERITREIK